VLQIQEGGKRLLHLTQNYVMHAELNVLTAHPPEQRSPQTAKSIITQSVIEQYLKEIPHYNDREHDCVLDIEQATIAISDLYLRKLVSELASNAMKFSPCTTPIAIKGSIMPNHTHYTLTFHDEGRGMSEDQIKKIGAFVQFERHRYEQQGAGLGLIICKQITEISDGTLHIESHLNHGTTVTVTLPIALVL
jgi:two-component system sensor histidine kinase/response regulator